MKHSDASVRWIYASLLAYAVGFAVFWPQSFLVLDEERYVGQALSFASRGGMLIDYPPATSLLQVPLVLSLGWRGAALLSVIGLALATLATATWLRDSGKPAAFALLVPGFAGAALFGRIAMSDVPSTALVAVACLFLWRATPSSRAISFACGLCVGASLLFREPLILILVPLLIGAMARGTISRTPAIVGVIVGITARLALSQAMFGSAWHVRDAGYGFSVVSLRHSLPVYGFILLVLVPAGALLPFSYRGPRRAELIAAVASYAGLFLFYEYDVVRDNGAPKGILLASRYMAPLTPVLAFLAADVCPRWATSSSDAMRSRLARIGAGAVVAISFLVHPLVWLQERRTVAIIDALRTHTNRSVPLITNTKATLKYLSPAFGERSIIQRYGLATDSVAAFRRHGAVAIALLNRQDSELFRSESRDNAAFLAQIRGRCDVRPQFTRSFGTWGELEVFDVVQCR